MSLSDPVRWHASDSNVDAELRETLQELRTSGPEPSQIEALVRSVEQAACASVPELPTVVRSGQLAGAQWLRVVAVALSAGLGGVTWYLLHRSEPSAAPITPAAKLSVAAPVPLAAPDRVTPSHNPARLDFGIVASAAREPSTADSPSKAPAKHVVETIETAPRTAQPAVGARGRSRELPPTRRSRSVPAAPTRRVAAEAKRLALTESHLERLANGRARTPLTTSIGRPGLASELELLTEAQRALATAPAQTLEFVEQHARWFPQGTLAEERDELRIDALSRLGRLDQARERASEFVRAYPRSTHLVRIRHLVGATPR